MSEPTRNRRRVTAADVAREAGVSQSAVSRVFTEGASVSGRMDARVREAAERLGYRPNVLARSLITGRTRIIGLVVAYLDNPFYPDAIEKLSAALQEEGYHLLIFTTGRTEMDVDRIFQELMDYRVDGIIAASINLSGDLAKRCREAGMPVVLFNRGTDQGGISAVTSDNVAGGRMVAEFLLRGGHRRLAHIAGWEASSTGRDRLQGFRDHLKGAGRPLMYVADGAYDRHRASEAARFLMGQAVPPDAIFVANDHMALAVMDCLRHDLGLRVPEDVSIVGYDDVPMAGWPSYDLTTVRQPTRRMVEASVAELMRLIAAPARQATTTRIDGPLVVRGSARLPEDRT
ncbi:LacI family DNA-binding transcriptional regulator [Jannaschia aquimarina]|uniref:RbsR protein n=1 Tax=Jannaschia aquimarina TaxID=935700 RepID=A0A0D1EFH5_9RHOB|nr:LacI family DNA-binding transcriptional regulator [Jannaschia aquimarina]KIT14645.1 Ribose operon repressor [Jannaschia aquimarina]SNT37599.1 transcriptional regulator, LacI family [Jannaschia aquimarina]